MPTINTLLFASVHKAKEFIVWAESHCDRLHLEFLPTYSPDFDPTERLWHLIKTEHMHNRCWPSKKSLRQHLRECLQGMPEQAEALRSLMKKENKRYQEICAFYQIEFQSLFATDE